MHERVARRQAALGRVVADDLVLVVDRQRIDLLRDRREVDDAKYRAAGRRRDAHLARRAVLRPAHVGRGLVRDPQQVRHRAVRPRLGVRIGAVEQHHRLAVLVDRGDDAADILAGRHVCFPLAHILAKPALGLDPRVDTGSPTRICAKNGCGAAPHPADIGSWWRAKGMHMATIRFRFPPVMSGSHLLSLPWSLALLAALAGAARAEPITIAIVPSVPAGSTLIAEE